MTLNVAANSRRASQLLVAQQKGLGLGLLKPCEQYWATSEEPLDLVVVPSMSVDADELLKIDAAENYEERQLFTLLLLRNPHARVIYLSSTPLDPTIISYYLSLLPPPATTHLSSNNSHTHTHHNSAVDVEGILNERLFMLSPRDGSPRPLSQKVLEHPRLMSKIIKRLRKQQSCKSSLLCFTGTDFERKMAHELDIPLMASPPDLDKWGSKSGSRELFEEAEIPMAPGIGLTHDVMTLAEGIHQLILDCYRTRRMHLHKVVVKLDVGFSGNGNAVLNLHKLYDAQGNLPSVEQIYEHLHTLKFASQKESWSEFKAKIQRCGVIAEEWLEGDGVESPSVQGVVLSESAVEILSTHEQMLKGQVYLGCIFPAREMYRVKLQNYGIKVGEVLASKGVRGHYGVDFVVRRLHNGEWDVHAIEINLRSTGTTHPQMTMRLLADGQYDTKSGLYKDPSGTCKYYVASDNLHKPAYIGLHQKEFLEAMARRGLRFDHASKTGPVFHLLGALHSHGKVGVTCIANSAEDAQKIFHLVECAMDEESARS